MSGYALPNAHAALVADAKIRDYLLDPQHPGNGGKAGFYASFGFTLRDWPKLACQPRASAALTPAPVNLAMPCLGLCAPTAMRNGFPKPEWPRGGRRGPASRLE
jgi:hypothetical protein